jgi:hypothetical protein
MEFAVEEIPFLQEVYRPNRGQRPEIDLVFVHGLNPFSNQNHAYDTWTHQNGRCWLYHFLPDDIPEARIWIFGYNSNVATDVSEARIKDHADVLLDRLQQKRKEGRRHGDIPIIFVGHSLGGLVIKQVSNLCLVQCAALPTAMTQVIITLKILYSSSARSAAYQAGFSHSLYTYAYSACHCFEQNHIRKYVS